ncbi:cache domain-containing protein [Aromatoleum diolicum]|uniref:Single Cache domain-containing protein n=1 Tax=Aromatoleum diolicum TaxID=75796 RepID=A0ABX1QEZ6_9RHOO|nr:cache domain-containing protein [Aromatoleum diolicum]NMG75947.1 hypothetical protein [Aromatoleum diolicum]
MRSTFSQIAACIIFSGAAIATASAGAAESIAAAEAADSAAARALLDRAAARYRTDGEAALAAFSRAGEFVTGDLYVYVLGSDGVMKASGGPSINLVGRNISDLKDPEGKPFVREILDGAKANGSGTVKYRWLNRQHGKAEQKVVYYQSVGDSIIAVGYYVPYASAEQAKAMLWRAVHEINQDQQAAIRSFNDLNGGFVQDDLYVFVIGVDDMNMYAHGAQPRLIGKYSRDLRDPDGKLFVQEMMRRSKDEDIAEVDYLWRNPVTQKTAMKTSYVKRVGRYLVGVGAYAKE